MNASQLSHGERQSLLKQEPSFSALQASLPINSFGDAGVGLGDEDNHDDQSRPHPVNLVLPPGSKEIVSFGPACPGAGGTPSFREQIPSSRELSSLVEQQFPGSYASGVGVGSGMQPISGLSSIGPIPELDVYLPLAPEAGIS